MFKAQQFARRPIEFVSDHPFVVTVYYQGDKGKVAEPQSPAVGTAPRRLKGGDGTVICGLVGDENMSQVELQRILGF